MPCHCQAPFSFTSNDVERSLATPIFKFGARNINFHSRETTSTSCVLSPDTVAEYFAFINTRSCNNNLKLGTRDDCQIESRKIRGTIRVRFVSVGAVCHIVTGNYHLRKQTDREASRENVCSPTSR